MRNFIYLIVGLLMVAACNSKPQMETSKKSHPSHKYHYVSIIKENLKYHETVYAPVYSDIYYLNGTLRYQLTATLSIRNISLTDTAFVLSAIYYDSYGQKLRDYTDSTIMLQPLESFELVVEQIENQGGAGANFIIDWGANKYSNQLMVQTVMIGTQNNQGVSLLSEAKVIKQEYWKE